MHCLCRKTFVFSVSVSVFLCEKVPRFIKPEVTLNKTPIWQGLKYWWKGKDI